MINKSIINKIFVGLCLTFLLTTLIGTIICFAIDPTTLASSASIQRDDGVVHIVNQSNRWVSYIDVNGFTGTITIDMGTSSPVRYVLSNNDVPEDIMVGYTFISTDYHSLANSQYYDISVSDYKYLYISSSRPFTYTLSPDITPEPTISPSATPTNEPTPSISPFPSPTNIPVGQGIPYHFDIPLDYYLILIIVILGGIVICLLFRN